MNTENSLHAGKDVTDKGITHLKFRGINQGEVNDRRSRYKLRSWSSDHVDPPIVISGYIWSSDGGPIWTINFSLCLKTDR
jgi:hypothetical protein